MDEEITWDGKGNLPRLWYGLGGGFGCCATMV
jgi:hypothetical protein